MKIRMWLIIAVAALCCCGAENEQQGRRFGRRAGGRTGNRSGNFQRGDNRQGGRRDNMMMRNQFFSEIEIAKKFPAEYAKVDALREQYEAELAALAKKASVELPASRDAAFRKLRKADPAGFDAALEKVKTSPRDGMMEMMALARKHGIELFSRPGGGRPGGAPGVPPAPDSKRVFNRPDMGMLRKKYPEKMREYDALRLKDREKAKKMLMEIIEADKSGKK